MSEIFATSGLRPGGAVGPTYLNFDSESGVVEEVFGVHSLNPGDEGLFCF